MCIKLRNGGRTTLQLILEVTDFVSVAEQIAMFANAAPYAD